ncbi:MAG: HEAT repeat domain-containing protein [Caldilineaceae bacterium]
MVQSPEEALRVLNDQSLEASQREAAIHYLREQPSAANAEQLVAVLEDDAPGVRWAAAMALGHYGQMAFTPLLRALVQPTINARLREGAHRVLSHTTAPEALPHLKEFLQALQGLGADDATMDVAIKILRGE